MAELGTDFTIATPAFPDNGRTVFKGHLFVGDVLLSDSGMKDHPLTPMRDANLVRVMQAQCQSKVGLIIAKGPDAFVDDSGRWFNGLEFKLHDWIVFRPSDGWSITVDGILCRMLNDVDVRARIDNPDQVY